MKTLKYEDALHILANNGIKNVNLEDTLYQIKDKKYFEPSTFRKILGFKKWQYALGGSDCGKFAVRYTAELYKKYQDKEGAHSYEYATNMPALLVGLVKYKRDSGDWHLLMSTIVNEDDKYKLVFFERNEASFDWITLSDKEKKSIKYFYAF